MKASAGVTVRATSIDEISANAYEIANGLKKAPEAFQEEDRRQHHQRQQGRVNDGAADLYRRVEDYRAEGLLAALGTGQAQPPPDVLDIDNRVIYNVPDGNDQARQDHHVYRGATELEDESR
jgi:hypothetical protein